MRGFANQRDDLLHTFILHGVSGNLATVVESLNVGRMTRSHHLRAWARNAPLGLWTHLRGGRMKQGAAPNRRVVVHFTNSGLCFSGALTGSPTHIRDVHCSILPSKGSIVLRDDNI